jgi:hypothetical protein
MWDGKSSIDISRLTPKGLAAYGESCGWTVARAHARSGDRIAMAAYLGDDAGFEQGAAVFARAYAEVNSADHHLLRAACDAGRIVSA